MLPPGFRFHPTDEELVGYYLKRKVEGLEIELEVIPVVDLYKLDPWELPAKSFLPKRDMEWFFFCARDRKYPNGSRTNRATKSGYWKATGKDRKVACHSSVSGYRKTLVFYRGRAPLGTRTDWLMHEYRLGDDQTQAAPTFQGSFALCRIVKKNELSQKGDCFGESKPRNVGSSSNNGDETDEILTSGNLTSLESGHSSPIPYEVNPISDFSDTDPTEFGFSSNLILDSSKVVYPTSRELGLLGEMHEKLLLRNSFQEQFSENITDYTIVQEPASGFFSQYESSSSAIPWPLQEIEHSDSLSQLEGFMSTGHENYMSFYGNDDISFEGFDQANSLSFPKQF